MERFTTTPRSASGAQMISITHQLAHIFGKIHELRRRVLLHALGRALTRAAWCWLGSLLLLGTLALLIPFPEPLRLILLLLHVAAMGAGAWYGARYLVQGRHSGNKNRLRRWALRCEEMFPLLGDRLVTCVDFSQEGEGAERFRESPVALALLHDTARHFGGFNPAQAVPKRLIQRAFGLAVVPFIVFFVLQVLLAPWPGRMATALYLYKSEPAWLVSGAGKIEGLAIRPGSVETPRGSSLTVEAELTTTGTLDLASFPPVLKTRTTSTIEGAADERGEQNMLADANRPAVYYVALHDIQTVTEYQVSVVVPPGERSYGDRFGAWLASFSSDYESRDANARESEAYTITPFDPPSIVAMRATLQHPAYTRLPEETQEGSYIAGLPGTTVTFRVESDRPLASAQLLDEQGKTIHAVMEDGPAGMATVARFDFRIEADASMRLDLTDQAGHNNLEPPLVVVHARKDEPPTVTVKRPGADWSVHPVAEITFEAAAEDDFGVVRFKLEYQLNGGQAETHVLYDAPADSGGERNVVGSHVLALETLGVKPGDSILYRFIAEDARIYLPEAGADLDSLRGFSQPYFLAVRPFDEVVFKGSASAGGSGPPPPTERKVIVATLRFAERQGILTDEERRTTADDIARTQREVRVETERMKGKLSAMPDIPNKAERLQHLDDAIAEMNTAESLLSAMEPEAALPHENSALQHQIAALVGLPIYENWMQDAMPSSFPPDPETALAGQKVEFEKDKYELFQPAQGKELDQALLKALEQTRDMAQRQKEFLEEISREVEEQNPGGGAGASSSSAQGGASLPPGARYAEMRQKAEEQRRELERLRESLRELDGLDTETADKIREAIERTARELAKASEEMAQDKLDEAKTANARAEQELLDLEQVLDQAKNANTKAQAEALAKLIDAWKKEQQALRTETSKPGKSQESREDGARRQEALGAQVAQAAGALAGSTGGMEPVEQSLEAAARWMEQAAQNLATDQQREALKGQDATLKQLQAAQEAIAGHLAQLEGNGNEPILQALAEIEEFKEYLEREAEAYADRQYIPDVNGTPQAQDSSPTEPPAGGPDSAVPPPSEGPPMVPDAGDPPTVIATKMARLQGLLQQHGQIGGMLSELDRTVRAGSSSWGDSGVTELIPQIMASLETIEDILRTQVEAADELQRLRQTRSQELPPQFRAMAAKYFEALGAAPASTP